MALTQIQQAMLADGILTADAAGRLKMADGFVNDAKISGVAASKISGQLADANMSAGSVLQVVSATKTNVFSTNSDRVYVDVTGLSVDITPLSANSKILILSSVSLGATAGSFCVFPRLARVLSGVTTPLFISDADGSRFRAGAMYEVGSACVFPVSMNTFDAPSTTNTLTYKVQLCTNSSANTGRVNANAAYQDNSNWSNAASSITVMEIAG